MVKNDPDIGIAAGDCLEHITVLDPQTAREGYPLACEDRLCGLFAEQGAQRVDVLTAGARLVFACHDHANAGAGKILDALNADRIAGRDQ